MKEGFVADCSVGIAWAAGSHSNPACDELLDEVAAGRPLVTRDHYNRARSLALLAPAVDEEGPGLALSRVSELAEQYALSVYDAVYLELTLRRGLPLASRDKTMNKVAKQCGVGALLL